MTPEILNPELVKGENLNRKTFESRELCRVTRSGDFPSCDGAFEVAIEPE